MNLETKITIYKFTPQVFTLTHKCCLNFIFVPLVSGYVALYIRYIGMP